MVPLEELYEVLSKARDLTYTDRDKTSCPYCHRNSYEWHDDECPIRALYCAISSYDDEKDMLKSRGLV